MSGPSAADQDVVAKRAPRESTHFAVRAGQRLGGLVGALPVGPGVGAGATVLILGSNGLSGVSAAGVLLTATGTLGAVGYAGWALTDRLWTKRTTRLQLRGSETARRAPALT